MKQLTASCIVLALATPSVSAVTPVQKVIQMMEAMVTKGTAAIKKEQEEFAEEKEFCEVTIIKKKRAIDDAGEKIELLDAEIEKAGTDAEDLANEIEAHTATLESSTSELDEATKVREKQAADFKIALADYTESITAIGKAMTVLNKQPKTRDQASFVQLKALSQSWPEDAKRSLDSFLEEDSDQPTANGYESSSGGIIEMLDKLKSQFIDERTALQKAELEKKNAYTMLKAGLDNEITQATKDKDDKSQTKGKRLEDKSIAEADLAETTDAKKADTKYREDLIASCRKKTEEYTESQKLRKEEMEAVGKAIEIISGGAVSGNADKHLPSLLSLDSSALAAVRSSLRSPALVQVMKQLQAAADRLESKELSAIAYRISQDPAGAAMKKVANMIKDMVAKLKKQAAEEATQVAWCAGEMKTNTATRKEKTQEVEGIQADIDELNASMEKLGEEVTQLSADVKDLGEAMTKATEIRQKEKAKNTVQIKDATEAQAAVAQAVTVLQEFYAKAGEVKNENVYNGMGGESGGVLGMIEVIQTDFARLEAEGKAAEEAGSKEYDTFMNDSKMDKVQKEKDVEHKTARKEREGQQVVSKNEDLAGVQKELDAAEEYYKTLVPKCVDKGPSYAEKKAKREEEIKSLKEALEALDLIR